MARPAFYALRSGGWRDYVTLLHPPYTAWHLSYVVIGAAAAPHVHWDRLGYALGAFFLGVGIAAHALDELRGRPLQTAIPKVALWMLAIAGLLGGLALGILGMVLVSIWLWPFVAFGLIVAVAYNLEWFDGQLHNDFWFAAAWGAFPVATTYWAMAKDFSTGATLLTAFGLATSLAQRRLSARVRALRRRAVRVSGEIAYRDGGTEAVMVETLLEVPEASLRWMAAGMVLLASGWITLRV
ncbi:MAG: hypothetical protein HY261_04600 [Chloroflexi bacterium]|nr:hypothetical protein [Chloroflexota bacterium]